MGLLYGQCRHPYLSSHLCADQLTLAGYLGTPFGFPPLTLQQQPGRTPLPLMHCQTMLPMLPMLLPMQPMVPMLLMEK